MPLEVASPRVFVLRVAACRLQSGMLFPQLGQSYLAQKPTSILTVGMLAPQIGQVTVVRALQGFVHHYLQASRMAIVAVCVT
jgi:hypothetical protein